MEFCPTWCWKLLYHKVVDHIQMWSKSDENKRHFLLTLASINENTNLMQRSYVFISPQSSTLHVSVVTSTHHQELQTCTIRYGIIDHGISPWMWSRLPTEFCASVVLARQCTVRVVVEFDTKSCIYVKKCSWGWVNLSPETCRADLKRSINEKVVASCWLFTSLYWPCAVTQMSSPIANIHGVLINP